MQGKIQRSSQNWIYHNPQELLRNMVPGAAYKGILSVVTTHLTTKGPPQHVPRVPGPGVGKGVGLTRVKKLDKGRQGGGEVMYSHG